MSEAPGSEVRGSRSVDAEKPDTRVVDASETEATREAGETEELAPLGGPAEAEPPQHTVDPDRVGRGRSGDDGTAEPAIRGRDAEGAPVEDSVAYELAVEDGAPLAAESAGAGADTGALADTDAGRQGPEFREPGA